MSINQRVRLSKKLLKDSLISLLNEKPLNKISVIEICEKAQINRTTFYKYYGSQYELLGDMEKDMLTQVNSLLSDGSESTDDDLQWLVKTFTFINDNVDLCRILFNNNVDPKYPEKLIKLPSIQQLVLEKAKCTDEELAYILRFVVDGAFGSIKRWLSKEIRETPEEIAAILYSMSTKLFS